MNIAIIAHNVVKRNNGQGEVNYAFVKFLIGKKHRVHLYANKVEPELKKDVIFHQIRVPQRPWILKIPLFIIFVTVRLLFKRYDVIYANTGTYFGKCNFRICQFCSAADLQYEVGFYHKLSTFINILIERIEYRRKGNKIIAVSKRMKNDLMRTLHIPEANIKVAYNKIDLSEFQAKSQIESKNTWRKIK